MKRRYRLLLASVLVLLLCIGSKTQTQPTTAVIELEGKGVSKTDASALTDRLRTELFNTGTFKVVERAKMDRILSEQGFQMTGCTNTECIVEAGLILGVTQMVAGSVSRVGNTYSVSVRIVGVETGEILNVATYDFKGEIDNLLSPGMRYVAHELAGESPERPGIGDEELGRRPETPELLQRRKEKRQPGFAIGVSAISFVPLGPESETRLHGYSFRGALVLYRKLTSRLLLELQVGGAVSAPDIDLAWGNNRPSDFTDSGYVEHRIHRLGEPLFWSLRLNVLVLERRNIAISLYGGYARRVFQYTHTYSVREPDPGAPQVYQQVFYNEKRKESAGNLPLGMNVQLFRGSLLSPQLELGLYGTTDRLEQSYPRDIKYKPAKLGLRDIGLTAALKLMVYL